MSRAVGVAALVMVLAGAARGEPAPERAWAHGVSADAQTRATELFERGNALLQQSAFVQAIELYREAIAIWDHPAIRYNLAVADIHLERQIAAYEELGHALRFGPDALQPDVYRQALEYQRLLHAQIVELTVECVDAGTKITLDGAELAVPCPGSTAQLILPGLHRMVATRRGSVTRTIELAPAGGEAPHERIDLMTVEEATVTRRRWQRWKPWSLVGAGVVIGLVGAGFELQSAATFRSYDKAVAQLCKSGPCTTLPGVVDEAYAEARRDNQIAIGLFVTAGVTIATGAALVWLNRAVAEQIGYDHVPIAHVTIDSHGLGIAARLEF
jgi:hypothetical protein